MSNYTENGINFNVDNAGIYTGGMKISRLPYQKDQNGKITSPQRIINAIDIDWNKAEVPGITGPISSTAQILEILGQLNSGAAGGSYNGPNIVILDSEEYEALESYEENTLYMVTGEINNVEPETPEPEDKDPFENISTNLNVSYVDSNGEIQETRYTTDGKISLDPQRSYTLEGTLVGSIEIDTSSLTKVYNDTELIFNEVKILSNTDNAILYKIPTGGKAQKSLKITLAPNTKNYVYCTLTATNTEEQMAAIHSMNNLSVQGASYLSIKTKSGHGLRGDVVNLGGSHIWIDAPHDGIHGRDIHIIGGVYSLNNCVDGIGTSNSGRVFFYDGSILTNNISGNIIDSKTAGLYFSEDLLTPSQLENCINMSLLSEQTYKAIFGNITGSIQKLPGKPDFDEEENIEGTEVELDVETDTYIISNSKGNKGKYFLVTGYINKPIQFNDYGAASGDNVTLYLNNAFIDTYNNSTTSGGNVPSVYYSADSSNIKLMAIQDSLNIIKNNYTSSGIDAVNFESDCVKSENNLEVELKNGASLYISSLKADGLDGSDVKITDSKGSIIITKCGQRGIKGNAVVVGPGSDISEKNNREIYYTKSYVDSYNTTHPTAQITYTTFDGICYVKNNCNVFMPVIANGLSDDDKRNTGFADIYGRNGKATKGKIGTTTAELNGVLIVGSMCAVTSINMGAAKRLYYNEIIVTNDNIQNPVPATGTPRLFNTVDPINETKNVISF